MKTNGDDPIDAFDFEYRDKDNKLIRGNFGLTKREYFAGLAMEALVKHENPLEATLQWQGGRAAKIGYYSTVYANALIKALNEDEDENRET
jgi:aminopeptidase C